MKNVEQIQITLSGLPTFRVPMRGGPPLSGFAVRLLSGMEEVEDVKPGYWLSRFGLDHEGYHTFNFEPELFFGFDKEEDARRASDLLRQGASIETAVVRVGF